MQKMSVSVPDSTMETIEAETKRLGKSRSHFVVEAIDFYIGTGRNLKNNINRLNEELTIKSEEAKSLSDKVLQLEESVPTIENRLAEAAKELDSRAVEVFQKDKKIHTLENQIAERDKKFESKASELEHLKSQIDQIREQLHESEKLKEKIESALKSKEDEISFLRGHVAQLTQSISQLSLPPSQEEAKKKGWWQFWK